MAAAWGFGLSAIIAATLNQQAVLLLFLYRLQSGEKIVRIAKFR